MYHLSELSFLIYHHIYHYYYNYCYRYLHFYYYHLRCRRRHHYKPTSQIPRCTCTISHHTPFRTEMHTFLFWMVYCGIWDGGIVVFVRLAYCCYLFLFQNIAFAFSNATPHAHVPQPNGTQTIPTSQYPGNHVQFQTQPPHTYMYTDQEISYLQNGFNTQMQNGNIPSGYLPPEYSETDPMSIAPEYSEAKPI